MITAIAVLICLVLLAAKLLADSSENRIFLRIGKLLVWIIIPLIVLFFTSLIIRVADVIPDLPIIF